MVESMGLFSHCRRMLLLFNLKSSLSFWAKIFSVVPESCWRKPHVGVQASSSQTISKGQAFVCFCLNLLYEMVKRRESYKLGQPACSNLSELMTLGKEEDLSAVIITLLILALVCLNS